MTTPAPMPTPMPTTPKARLTARELYAKVRRVAKLHSRSLPHAAFTTLRQIDAGQNMRLRTILERDAALTFVARAKGSIVPVDKWKVKEATDMAARASLNLKKMPQGDRRVRRLAAQEMERAKRRLAKTKTEYRIAT